jgi:hypothetical protein
MAKVVLYMSMSLDGFITGPDDGLDHGLGVNGERLHDWLRAGGLDLGSHRPVDGPSAIVFDRPAAEDLPPDHIELELLRALDGPGVLHLRYRVRSEG